MTVQNRIGVVDWFTKNQKEYRYGPESDREIEDLISKLGSALRGEGLFSAANSIFGELERSEFYQGVCSDTRLPVCSLFHHSKNTSAIAACLVCHKLSENAEYKNKLLREYGLTTEESNNFSPKDIIGLVRLGALLHDIGKPRTYTEQRGGTAYHHHTVQTAEIIQEILDAGSEELVTRYQLRKILPLLASRHHGRDVSTEAEELIHLADMVSSAADRMYEVKGEIREGMLEVHSEDAIFPHIIDFSGGDFQPLKEPHTEVLGYNDKKAKPVKTKKETETPVLFYDRVVKGGPFIYTGEAAKIEGRIGYLAIDIMRIQQYIAEAEKLPMLRGGSVIVEEILNRAKGIVEREVCPEAVLFSGGGNLLAFVPLSEGIRNSIVDKIRSEIDRITGSRNDSGEERVLEAAIVTGIVDLSRLAGRFSELLRDIQFALEREKQRPRFMKIKKPASRDRICPACNNREIRGRVEFEGEQERLCIFCEGKREWARSHRRFPPELEVLMGQYHLKAATELQHIGDAIAVIVADGNMMGRIFRETLTPADYTYKSSTFDQAFKDVYNRTLAEFVKEDLEKSRDSDSLVVHRVKEEGRYLGLYPIYQGGDDLLLIMNARGAIQFAKKLIENIAEKFSFEISSPKGGEVIRNPTVTLSCGIAIADAKFPIYFLLDAARRMEAKAKKEFRLHVKTNERRLHELPSGALAITAVSGAMPADESAAFVIGEGDRFIEGRGRLKQVIELLEKSLWGSSAEKQLITRILTTGESSQERLNVLKFEYAAGLRKSVAKPEEWIALCERMGYVFSNNEVMNALKMLVPFVWKEGEGAA